MTGVCVQLKPQSPSRTLTAIIALYRPGPMDSIPRFIACKSDPEPDPLQASQPGTDLVCHLRLHRLPGAGHDDLPAAGRVTLWAAQTWCAVPSPRKRPGEIEQERDAFIHGDPERNIKGCVANGIPEETAQQIYDDIYDFANYAFNKAHAVCYAIVAYQTAYFKCHYPKEYMAALLTSVLDSSGKVAEYIAECKEMGIRLLPPDINESGADFTVVEEGIRFGLVGGEGHRPRVY